MLDVSIRVGVLNMMAGLRDQEGVSILYITHDLASARYVADRIIVMYAGHLVEAGPTETVLVRSQASLHAVAALRGGRPAGEGRAGLRRHRRAAPGHQPERRMPLPLAVPARDREVLAGHAPPGADRTDARSPATSRSPRRRRPEPRAPPRSRTADAFVTPRSVELVIFDCDGVLIDSERLAIKVDVEMLHELGWPLSEAEVIERFVGRSDRETAAGDRGPPRSQAAQWLGRAGQAALPARVRRRAHSCRRRARGADRRSRLPSCIASSGYPRAPALHARFDGPVRAVRGADLQRRGRGCRQARPRPVPARRRADGGDPGRLRGRRGQPRRGASGTRGGHARARLRRRLRPRGAARRAGHDRVRRHARASATPRPVPRR